MKTKKEVRTFYHQFSGRVIVGLEASGYSPWFEQLLEDLGHEVWLGDATEIRRRGAHFQLRAGASDDDHAWLL
jgi:transposase